MMSVFCFVSILSSPPLFSFRKYVPWLLVYNVVYRVISCEQVRTLNVLGIHNVSLDIAALTDFADESGIGTLRECFAKVAQLVDIVLT